MPVLPRELHAAAAWRHPRGPIKVPTLFLLGAETDTRLYLDGLDDLQAAFRDGQQVSIPGQHHVAHVVAAQVFAELVAGSLGRAGSLVGRPSCSLVSSFHRTLQRRAARFRDLLTGALQELTEDELTPPDRRRGA